jgi:lysophospholipase L1-like esterase
MGLRGTVVGGALVVTALASCNGAEEVEEDAGVRYVALGDSYTIEAFEIAFVSEPYLISLEAADEPELVADDGLHPSGEQYRRWTDAIVPVIEDQLRD